MSQPDRPRQITYEVVPSAFSDLSAEQYSRLRCLVELHLQDSYSCLATLKVALRGDIAGWRTRLEEMAALDGLRGGWYEADSILRSGMLIVTSSQTHKDMERKFELVFPKCPAEDAEAKKRIRLGQMATDIQWRQVAALREKLRQRLLLK
jgi:hypothetical protein